MLQLTAVFVTPLGVTFILLEIVNFHVASSKETTSVANIQVFKISKTVNTKNGVTVINEKSVANTVFARLTMGWTRCLMLR